MLGEKMVRRMRAIDFYAGIGGWSLGLRLAGVEVVNSYEWWQPAIDTHNGNHGTELTPVNIRELTLDELPKDIDVVVGSPPCTQFSYSNRGGSGDIDDGLVDLVKFFEAVQYLRPRFWAMENVPRVAKVIEEGFSNPEHPLYRFRDLRPNVAVVDFSKFGCAQARRRCIATNLDFDKIGAFSAKSASSTLGEVVNALGHPSRVVDPVWGVELAAEQLTEMEKEEFFSDEERRMNEEAKTFHPVYNNMSFPDKLDVPSRTVTATCTRVSRESIVVADTRCPNKFRRLTVRERATLQGFPITYQFFGKSFSEKAKMVGNAIPPSFTYILGLVMLGETPEGFAGHFAIDKSKPELVLPIQNAPKTVPDTAGRTYPAKRRFKAAIPNLRFKSGMRFEFANHFESDLPFWDVRFYSGNSKQIFTHMLDDEWYAKLTGEPILSAHFAGIDNRFSTLATEFQKFDPIELQKVWARKVDGKGPYWWVDCLGACADQVHQKIVQDIELEEVEQLTLRFFDRGADGRRAMNEAKITTHAARILSGLIVGSWANRKLHEKKVAMAA